MHAFGFLYLIMAVLVAGAITVFLAPAAMVVSVWQWVRRMGK